MIMPMQEFTALTEVAGRSVTGIGRRIRHNLVPPVWQELRLYDRVKLRADLIAGLTVALVTIPQAIGFALIVGLPVHAVLGTAVIGALVCALFSSSRHLVFGPTNTISIILAGAVLALGDVPLTSLQKVVILGFLVGLFQLVAGLTNTGRLTQFISRTVVIAYTTAVGILITAGQAGHLLGIDRAAAVSLPGTLHHLLISLLTWKLNLATAVVGLASLWLLLLLRRLRPGWPDGLIVLTLSAAVFLAWPGQLPGIKLVGNLGEISGQVPLFIGFPLNIEALALVPRVTSMALAVAILGMLEAVSIAKSLAARSGQKIDPNQELVGMGLGNIVCSAFGAMPGSASFLRSAANLQSGGRTQLATAFSCGFILLLVLLFSPLLNFIPVATLAAYLVTIAFRLINPQQVAVARRATRSDAAVFWVTLVAALFLQLDTAIYVGVGLSLLLFLQKASTPTLVEYAFNDTGQLAAVDDDTPRNNPQVSIVHVEGDLFFGAADLFQDQVRQLAGDTSIRVVVLRLKNARHLDATTVLSLLQLHEYLEATGRHLLLSGVGPDVERVLTNSGALARLGVENVFAIEDNPTLSTKRALERAQQLLPGIKPDLRIFYDRAPQPTA